MQKKKLALKYQNLSLQVKICKRNEKNAKRIDSFLAFKKGNNYFRIILPILPILIHFLHFTFEHI